MNRDLKGLIKQMTLEEKAGLCSGADFWHTKAIERLGIPSIMMTDGPHGLRKQEAGADHLGINTSVPATCYPAGAALACSWDRELIEKIGIALGEECQAEGVSIILGPAANIKRSPLCGRNFEYFSEDPCLSSEMAASHIRGVQSQGVGTSLKHFAANNQEYKRFVIDAKVDERTLREIYLTSFEGAVKQSQPWTVMCAYNRLNGTYCCEDPYILTEVLKKEWGHEGFVVSDWGAVNERADGVAAGLELEMPASGGINDQKIVNAVNNGTLSEEALDKAVERLLKIIFLAVDNRKENAAYDKDAHHALARKAAGECMVLLKNDDHILPLKKGSTLAVIGGFAQKARYQGGGSSHINPSRLDSALEEIRKLAGESTQILYADGYRLDEEDSFMSGAVFRSVSDVPDEDLIREAVEAAAKSDAAVVFAGLPASYESEGYDRKHMRIPEGHSRLIEAVTEANPNTVVVLSNGAPIEMPWLGKVKAVLEGYLGGQAFGSAAADVLFGAVSPSGKLAETFPVKLSDNPSHLNFPGDAEKVEYREGLFVGYRYYEAKEMETLFPFGYGLSYTSFSYTGISVDQYELIDTDTLTVKVRVKNTGSMAGKEVVQLYVRDKESSVVRPYKELKDFQKAELQPGEEREVAFTLGKRAFAYYNVDIRDWYVENGEFEILVGGSSQDTPLKATVTVRPAVPVRKKFSRNSTLAEVMTSPIGAVLIKNMMVNSPVPMPEGGISDAMMEMMGGMPLRSIAGFSQGKFSEEMLDAFLEMLNA
jgi:beta-glucosidase